MKTAYVSLVISILVLAFSAYLFETDRRIKLQLRTQSAMLEENTQKIASVQQNLQKQTEVKSQAISLSRVPAEQSSTPKIWEEQEAIFLIKLANEQLQLTQDVKKTITILETAEQNLKEYRGNTNSKLLDAINKDIMALKEVKLPDVEELWVQIGILSDKVYELPIRGLPKTEQQNVSHNNTAEDDDDDTIRAGLKKSWYEFKDLVKIRRHSKPIEPILETAEATLAKDHLSLLLLQIRLALLEKKQVIYQEGLIEALNWLELYFDTTDDHVQKMAEELKALEKISIAPPVPTLETLHLIKDFR